MERDASDSQSNQKTCYVRDLAFAFRHVTQVDQHELHPSGLNNSRTMNTTTHIYDTKHQKLQTHAMVDHGLGFLVLAKGD